MSAIAGNFGDIFLARRFADRTAIFIIISDRTHTRFVSAFIVFIRHNLKSSLKRKKILVSFDTLNINLRKLIGNERQ